MKNILIVAFLSLTLSSCTSTIPRARQLTAQCDMTQEDFLRDVTTLVMNERMNIKQSDYKLGFMQAETSPRQNFQSGRSYIHVWTFKLDSNKLVAMAKTVSERRDEAGRVRSSDEIYYDDTADMEESWYWKVREGLQEICGNHIIFTDKKE